MRNLIRRVSYWIQQRRLQAELAEEMAQHRALTERALEDGGLDPAEARLAARRTFGSAALAQDRARDVWIPAWLQGLPADVRLAVRTLWATRIVSLVAVGSLALGIGANTAIFSLVNALLLRTLPVATPERLVSLSSTGAAIQDYFSYPVWSYINDRREIVDPVFAWGTSRFNLASRGETEFVNGVFASGAFFETLGVRPWLGRTFDDVDDRRGGGPDGPVAVVGYRFWQSRYGGSPDAIGRRLEIEGVPFTIVGVTPPAFFGVDVGRGVDVFVPIGAEPLMRGRETALDQPNRSWLGIIARLKPGQTRETAAAALRAIQPDIRKATLPPTYPPEIASQYLKEPFTLVPAATGMSYLRDQYQRPLLTMLVVVSLVLLIACANVANLLLARTTARRHELAVRRALGASGWRLARQLLVESALVAGVGAALGLAVASWGGAFLVRQISTAPNSVFLDLALDWRVLSFTVTVTMMTVLVFGTAPALRAAGVAPMGALKDDDRGASSDRRGAAAVLMVAQVALSVMLVVAAGLFVRTFTRLASQDLGFNREGVLLVTMNSQRAAIAPADRIAVFDRAREVVGALPSVAHAGVSIITPVGNMGILWRVTMPDGATVPDLSPNANVFANQISPGWLATMGTPLIAGRDFTERDVAGAAMVVIVNESLARAFVPGGDVIGRSVLLPYGRAPSTPIQIVGVVANAAYRSVREPAPRTLYLPLMQAVSLLPVLPTVTLAVRARSGPPAALARNVESAIAGVNPALALTFRPLAEQVDAALTQERLVAMLSGFFALLALLLAALGLYGVTAYAVSRRRREIGIRIALGAGSGSVARLVVARVAALVGAGIAIGVGLSAWASTFVRSLLYGLEPRDPAALATAIATLSAVAAAAAWGPVRRATRVDPVVALRYE